MQYINSHYVILFIDDNQTNIKTKKTQQKPEWT